MLPDKINWWSNENRAEYDKKKCAWQIDIPTNFKKTIIGIQIQIFQWVERIEKYFVFKKA